MQPHPADFQSIHGIYRPRVLRYLKRLVGERDAEDLTQLVMVKVSDGLAHFRGGSQLSTWIYRIATNTALDRLRSPHFQAEGRSHAIGAPDSAAANHSEEELDRLAQEQSPSTEATVIRREMNACIREFVDRLADPYRAVIVLSEIEGFKNGEIAEILGVSVNAVKIRLHRAREKLKQSLADGCHFGRDERNEFACDRKPPPAATS